MHRVLISGHYGFGSLGDEAILVSAVDGLKSIERNIDITVLSASPFLTEEHYGLRAVDRRNFFEIYLAIKNCDLFICGGGSLFQDADNGKSIRYYLGLIAIAKYLNKKVMIYGQGIGPIYNKANRKLAGTILNRVDAITVRDEKSLENLKNMGVSKPPVYLTADPAVTLKPLGNGSGLQILRNLGINKKQPIAAFAVGRCKKGEKFNRVIARAADSLVEELGFQAVFIPFHYREDKDCIVNIMSLMKNQAYFLDQTCSIRELLDLIGEMDLVVGMRLHSLIFSAIQGIPLVGLPYHPKIDVFLSQLGMKAVGDTSLLELSDLLIEVQRVWNSKDRLKKQITERMNNMKELAAVNNVIACQLLNK